MQIDKTERGFEIIKFTDHNNASCSLQQSSAILDDEGAGNPGSSLIWLGCDKNAPPHLGHEMSPRMHLTREQVESLLDMLTNWLNTGLFSEEG